MKSRNILSTFLFILSSGTLSWAQMPANYYADTVGLTGYALKTKLSAIISTGHVDKGYGGLWTGYAKTDRDYYYENDGTLLDIYSEKPAGADAYEYNIPGGQCGNYNSEGDCYNREHTIPQSLFSSAAPMHNDINFVVPTDGKVNGQRSDFPYGTVSNPTWTSSNGSKLGPNTAPGYTGTAFEPIDEFKGDIARMAFYFVTRYQNQVPGFTIGSMLDGTTTRGLQQWYVNLLLNWHHQDTVSVRERNRNDSAFSFQGNRNPYIDHPEWVDCIWGTTTCGTTNVDTNSTGIKDYELAFSLAVYPNPANDVVQINTVMENPILGLTVSSIDGRELIRLDFGDDRANRKSLNVAYLNPGLYLLSVKTKSGTLTKKLVKQ